MCPLCQSGDSCIYKPLNTSCYFTKVYIVFDNYATVFFAVFMSFWATAFLNLWNRLENVLKIRWNVEFVETDTKIRLKYKEKAKHKRLSLITGELEPYTPIHVKALYLTLTYGTCLLLVAVVLFAVFGVIMYRIIMAAAIRMSDSEYLELHGTILVTSTSATLQVIFIKLFGRFYAPLSEWLTDLENPRTQSEFDNSVVHKRYFLGFANNYSALFYIAFVKGRFYTPAYKPSMASLEADICHPCGCLMALCVQLSFMMLFKSLAGNILTLIIPKITKRFKKSDSNVAPEWEEEFQLEPAGRYLLTTEFMEMIVQYGFVTFFVTAFPLAPLCALINNAMELRLDAYKLVTRYRRPIPKRHSGIGPWNGILGVITHLSIATNAFVLAFTSDFVAREIYKYRHDDSLKGYVLSTLSLYEMTAKNLDCNGPHCTSNSMLCYYKALRYPPNHPKKYKLTPEYWYELGMRLLCVIIFEHVIMVLNGCLSYFIPDVPHTVKESINHERNVERDLKLKISAANNKNKRRPKLAIKRNDAEAKNDDKSNS